MVDMPPIEHTMLWVLVHPRATPEMLGYIPGFFNLADPRSAKEQLSTNYIGGWHPFTGFTLLENLNLSSPGDPPTRLLARTVFRDEKIFFYEHSWLLIMQKDGTWEVSRCD